MTNPLRRETTHYAPVNWPRVVAERNANLYRRDIEWAVNPKGDGIYLRDVYGNQGVWQEWKPEPGEVAATEAVAARAINAGIPMEEWARLVRNGSITREVQKAMNAGGGDR